MCETCGCGHHHHDDGHSHGGMHSHDGGLTFHSHDDSHHHRESSVLTVPLKQAVLADNNTCAEENRTWFTQRGITAYNLISSPGSGKTALLVETLKRLKVPAAVIVGDPYGEYDAERMRVTGVPVTQIQVHESCHLSARQVHDVLETAVPEGTRIVFIENVGNLVCPVAFDLGECAKIALVSTPEGEEKPLKYPALFAAADAALVTKTDLAGVLGSDLEFLKKNILRINPVCRVLFLSARTGEGMDGWMVFLKSNLSKEGERR